MKLLWYAGVEYESVAAGAALLAIKAPVSALYEDSVPLFEATYIVASFTIKGCLTTCAAPPEYPALTVKVMNKIIREIEKTKSWNGTNAK